MIQMVRTSSLAISHVLRINLYDKFNGTGNYKPLCSFTSQASGNRILALPLSYNYTNKERYVEISLTVSSVSIPTLGLITFGTKDLPYGLYDTIIYENISNVNFDPSGLNVVWKGLANLSAEQTGTYKNPAVEYTDYNTNDADTESVYITC